MKKLALTFSMLMIATLTFAQWEDNYYTITFEDPSMFFHINIDTINHPNNSWHIGPPTKTVFTSANSLPNVIVTDLDNSYPPSDTSVFIIKNVADGGGFEWPHTAILAGYYYVNSDTLTDFGSIEFSPDNGITWIDMINDTVLIDSTSSMYWYWNWFGTPIPVLTGNSNGWQQFGVNLAPLGHFYNVTNGDTILYRFTFVSDSLQTNKDGLMFDDLHFEDWVEGVEEFQAYNLISISPNPATTHLTINCKEATANSSVQIFNYNGQTLYTNRNFTGKDIDISTFNNGIYLLKYSTNKHFEIKKFIINR